MCITDNLTANNILNEIYNIICDDNLTDIEALEKIISLLKKYNVCKECRTIEKKQNGTN